MNRRSFIGASGVAVFGTLAGCLARGVSSNEPTTEVVERSYSAADVREVTVSNGVGDIVVAAHGTGDVEAHVVKRSTRGQAGLDDLEVALALEDGVLSVTSTLEGRWFGSNRETPRADVTITVPESDPTPVVTALETRLGDVTALGTRGDTAIQTDLGDVVASGVDGYVTLSSALGSILATDVAGIDAVHTDLGDLKVDVLSVRDDTEIGTDLGEVTVGVADDLDLEVVAASTGSVDSNLPLQNGRTVDSRLTGQLNDGGHRLRVYSELGDVSLRSITRPDSQR